MLSQIRFVARHSLILGSLLLLGACQSLAPIEPAVQPTPAAQAGSPSGSAGAPAGVNPGLTASGRTKSGPAAETVPVSPQPPAGAASDAPAAPSWSGRPRLVVTLLIDGLPARQLMGIRDQLGPDGFNRFLDHGQWFADAHHGQAYTVTAVGHAALLTGAYPERTGIIGNDWRDVQTGELRYCTDDTSHVYIGQNTRDLDGTSPRNLRVDTVGDVLRELDPRARVIGISAKDRGAILPAGHRGTAYMYMSQTGAFASSTYYMDRHPDWVNVFNDAKPADHWFQQQWKPLLSESAYARSLPDRQPWFAVKDVALPMTLDGDGSGVPGPRYYSQLLVSPFIDQLTLDFARAAIEGEGLGRDDVPDVLAISLSGHDYVNHRYSAESRISQDHLLRLDRMLQEFFRYLDRTVGKDRYVMALTADHGFMPAPEVTAQQGLRSGRINATQMLARLNAALEQEFGAGKWVSFSASGLLINRELLARTGVDPDEVAEELRNLLMDEAGIAVAYTRRDLAEGRRSEGPFYTAVRRSWNADVSGDVQFVLKPYWMFASGSVVATHGSPYPYDTQVPLLIWGPRWIRSGRVESRVEIVDLAPTVAHWLGIAAPRTSQGRLLPGSR